MREKYATIAIASPGARQESLRAILSAVDQLDLVGMASGALTGWQMVCDLAPDLVVIEGSLPDEEIALLLNHLKFRNHGASSLVLVHSRHQERMVTAAGASAVLTGTITLRGFGSMVRAIYIAKETGLHTSTGSNSDS